MEMITGIINDNLLDIVVAVMPMVLVQYPIRLKTLMKAIPIIMA
jgi:hypothetical protein